MVKNRIKLILVIGIVLVGLAIPLTLFLTGNIGNIDNGIGSIFGNNEPEGPEPEFIFFVDRSFSDGTITGRTSFGGGTIETIGEKDFRKLTGISVFHGIRYEGSGISNYTIAFSVKVDAGDPGNYMKFTLTGSTSAADIRFYTNRVLVNRGHSISYSVGEFHDFIINVSHDKMVVAMDGSPIYVGIPLVNNQAFRLAQISGVGLVSDMTVYNATSVADLI